MPLSRPREPASKAGALRWWPMRCATSRRATAIKEIKGLIGTSVDRVEQGSQLAEQTGSTMEAIVAAVCRVSDIVDDISRASREQSTGVGQVNEAVMQMKQATQQSAATTTSLRQQAEQLVQAVSVFRLDRALTA